MTKALFRITATAFLIAGLASCGGGISLTEYVDTVNEAVVRAQASADELIDEGVFDEASAPPEIGTAMRRVLEEVRLPLQEAMDTIDPPEEVGDLHTLLWSWHTELIDIETAVAEQFAVMPETVEGWTLLSASDEMAAYRESLAEGKLLCVDFQAELDATEARGAFGDAPWVPSKLSEVVEIALGCDSFPEDPQSVFRYP